MVLGEEGLVTLLTDVVPPALVRVHVFLQVVGVQEVFVTLRTLDLALPGGTKGGGEIDGRS